MNRSFLKGFWQLVAGALCVATGVGAIFLGWYGASHTRDVTDQIPYLISGGVFGLALVVLGSALYFSHFVADAARATRRQQRLLEQTLAQRVASGAAENGAVVTVPGGASYHRPGCPLAGGKQASPHSAEEASELGYAPCPVCEPAVVN